MTTYQSPDRIVTITLTDGQVSDVLLATGRRFRDGELEAAIAHVLNEALAASSVPAAESPSQDQLDQVADLTASAQRYGDDALRRAEAVAQQLRQWTLPG